MPTNWNSNEFFIFRYVDPIKKNLLLVKIVPSDTILLVNVLLKNKDQIFATTIDPKKLITDDYKQFDKLFQDDNSLDSLVGELKKEIIDKFEAKKTPVKQSNTSTEQSSNYRDTNPHYIIDDNSRRSKPNPLLIPQTGGQIPSQFPQIGGAGI